MLRAVRLSGQRAGGAPLTIALIERMGAQLRAGVLAALAPAGARLQHLGYSPSLLYRLLVLASRRFIPMPGVPSLPI